MYETVLEITLFLVHKHAKIKLESKKASTFPVSNHKNKDEKWKRILVVFNLYISLIIYANYINDLKMNIRYDMHTECAHVLKI